MKALVYIALLLGSAAAGYFLYPKFIDNYPNWLSMIGIGEGIDGSSAVTSGGRGGSGGAPKGSGGVTTATSGSGSSELISGFREPTPSMVAKAEKAFPIPKFKTLDQVVGNWLKIPKTVFPRPVKTTQAVEFKVASGSSKYPAGKSLVALSSANKMLVVAPDEKSKLRATIPIDHTNMKEILAGAYEKYKKKKINVVKAQRLEHSSELASKAPRPKKVTGTNKPSTPGEDMPWDPGMGEKPKVKEDGTVPLMIESIMRGEVKEIKLSTIERWGPIRIHQMRGKKYWAGTVHYKATTVFGEFDTTGMALIREGRVIRWIYAGSQEPIP